MSETILKSFITICFVLSVIIIFFLLFTHISPLFEEANDNAEHIKKCERIEDSCGYVTCMLEREEYMRPRPVADFRLKQKVLCGVTE